MPKFHRRCVDALCRVDRDTDEPWPLCVEDGAGGRHHVVLEPGEMLLYEGARLRHGRPYPLCGASYAGIYLHIVRLVVLQQIVVRINRRRIAVDDRRIEMEAVGEAADDRQLIFPRRGQRRA